MPELREWLFALCVGTAAGATWVLWTFLLDWLVWHLNRLVAVLREATR